VKSLLLAAFIVVTTAGPRIANADSQDSWVPYRVKAGDTLELVAAEYYGDRHAAVFIMVANRIPHPRPLRPGEKLRIPTPREVTTSSGDTFESLAARHLGDGRRARFLAEFNAMDAGDSLAVGMNVSVPFHVTHVAVADETLSNIAAAYFGKTDNAELLREYNFFAKEALAKGESLVIPIHHVRVRPSRSPPVDAESKARSEKRRALQERVRVAVPVARASWRSGDYAAVKRELADIDLEYLDAELAMEVGLLLGGAYVAFDDGDSARALFRRVLERASSHQLDGYLYSPRIRAVWQQAGGTMRATR
jgi:LysM repeat protein